MSQYDNIGADYNDVKTIFHNRIEKHNIERVVRPFLQNRAVQVLDFACGTGFYSQLLLEWGASKMVGVDLSDVMVQEAVKRFAGTPYAERARFIQGDARVPEPYSIDVGSHGFDIVTAFWLLNYAKDKDELKAMFQSIALNLKDDGVFIGCLLHPTEDVVSHAEAINAHGVLITGALLQYERELENHQGYVVNFVVKLPQKGTASDKVIQFEVYHLQKHLFEEAARAAGMSGSLEWVPLEYLNEQWLNELKIEETDERWLFLKRYPCMAMLVIHKT